MSINANKQLVVDFFTHFVAADVDSLLSLLNDDVIWKMMGQQGGLPLSGEMDKSGIADFTKGAYELFSGSFKMMPKAWTIDGDRIAVEVESLGIVNNEREYNNLYHYLFVLSKGKITTIKEYADTDLVRRVF
ncbi:nuclear transport factor 2 family protein, partial [Pseudomonadota bacterium]